MTKQRAKVMTDLLVEHFEELEFLWGQRRSALRSPRYTLRELAELEERIDAHVQGLLVGEEHLQNVVAEGLAAAEPDLVFAAAYPLLRLGHEAGEREVLRAFRQAEDGQLVGLREAIACGASSAIRVQLRALAATTSPLLAVKAEEALAFDSPVSLRPGQLDRFFQHELPALRQSAWRTASHIGPVSPDAYTTGLRDADPAVRDEALLAAAWGRHAGLLDHCRRLAATPTPEDKVARWLLAVLGKPEDLPRILRLGEAASLGPERFQILGAYGHPGGVDLLLQALIGSDARAAVAAGAAFTKITCCDIASDKRATLPPTDGSEPNEFDREFLEEVTLPDAPKAAAHWNTVRDRFSSGTRWCWGLDLSQGGNREVWDRLDLESRWEAHLRGVFWGLWQGRPADLERFPQKLRDTRHESKQVPVAVETKRDSPQSPAKPEPVRPPAPTQTRPETRRAPEPDRFDTIAPGG